MDKPEYIKPEKVIEIIDSKEAVELLTKEIPSMRYERALGFDFRGKDLWQFRTRGKIARESVRRAYYCRVVAARGFEELAEQEKNLWEKIGRLEEAAFSYDKAAKNADYVGFDMANVRCRIRACRIYNTIDKITESQKHRSDLEIAAEYLKQAVNKIIHLRD